MCEGVEHHRGRRSFDNVFWQRGKTRPGSTRYGFFARWMSSFIYGNTVSAPIHGPGSGAAIAEPTLCVGFACGKKPKKPPLIPRRGPLWKPRRSDGVARDGLRSSQGKCSLLQYPFFPVGTAHPGSHSKTPPAFAGGQTCRIPNAYLVNILFPVGP